jgi:hypothetical protein
MRRARVFFTFIVIAAAGAASATLIAQTAAPPGITASSLVARYLSRSVQTPASYRARRHLEAANPRFHLSAWLDAITELRDGHFTYTEVAHGGSDLIYRRVLVAALDAERDLATKDDADAMSTTSSNYQFESTSPGEGGEPRIRLIPRRKDKRLIDGWIVLTPEADVVQVTGQLAKAPSFWTTSVTFTRDYRQLDGLRVPRAVSSVADVRVAGRSTFAMSYVFEEINGKPVDK